MSIEKSAINFPYSKEEREWNAIFVNKHLPRPRKFDKVFLRSKCTPKRLSFQHKNNVPVI